MRWLPAGTSGGDRRRTPPLIEALTHPGAWRFTGAGAIARLELAMGMLGIVLLVRGTGGSFTLATLLTGAHAASLAIASPFVSRLIDRFGQSRVLWVQVSVYTPVILGLIVAIQLGAPVALLITLAVVEGAAHPMVGSLVRARWSWLLGRTDRIKPALAWESTLDAALIAVGAPLATILALQVMPAAALLVAGIALILSSVLLAVQRATEPPPARPPSSSQGVSTRSHRPPPAAIALGLVSLCFGANVGAFDIAVVGRADEAGQVALVGWMLAAYALGSTVGGVLASGRPARGRLPLRYALLLALLALGAVPLMVVGDPGLLIGAAALAGLAVAPSVIMSMTILEQVTPRGRITEALAWTGSGLILGRAIGQMGAGRLTDDVGAVSAFFFASGCAAIACVVALSLSRHLGRHLDASAGAAACA